MNTTDRFGAFFSQAQSVQIQLDSIPLLMEPAMGQSLLSGMSTVLDEIEIGVFGKGTDFSSPIKNKNIITHDKHNK